MAICERNFKTLYVDACKDCPDSIYHKLEEALGTKEGIELNAVDCLQQCSSRGVVQIMYQGKVEARYGIDSDDTRESRPVIAHENDISTIVDKVNELLPQK